MNERNITSKVKKLHRQWQNLQKNRNKHTVCLVNNRNTFIDNLDSLFDIASKSINIQTYQDDPVTELLSSLRANKRLSLKVGNDIEIASEPEILIKYTEKRKAQENELHYQNDESENEENSLNQLQYTIPEVSPPRAQIKKTKSSSNDR